MIFLKKARLALVMLLSSTVADGTKQDSKNLRRNLAKPDLPPGVVKKANKPDFPPGLVKKFDKLGSAAQEKLSGILAKMNFKRSSDGDYLDFNDEGDVWFVDPPPPDTGEFPIENGPNGQQYPTAIEFEPSGVPVYHSRPGATYTLYLDFDGHQWVGRQSGGWVAAGQAVDAFPYKYDDFGNPSFSAGDLAVIGNSWAIVAEDFAPFDIDVTTQEPADLSLDGIGHVLITGSKIDKNNVTIIDCGCGGVAFLGVFPVSNYGSYHERYSPALVFNSGLRGVAEAISHEFGHNLGLAHDGKDAAGYYSGHGSGETDWAPIMGVGYYANTVQWSNGDYDGATQTQDDLAIIASKIGYATDDYSDDTALDFMGTNLGYGKGIIESNTDVDNWTFTIPLDSPVSIVVNTRDNRYGNLDAGFTLSSSSGVIAAVAPENTRDASWTGTLSAGSYSVAIEGTKNGANSNVGYSDYGSLGQYQVTVEVENLATCTTAADCRGISLGVCESILCESGQCIVATDDPCCGDGVCFGDETFATCAEDCSKCTVASDCTGLNPGTCESVDCVADECVFVPTVPCCGNDVCDLGETFATCTEDCPKCTIASDCTGLNPGTCESVDCVADECVFVPTVPCCGNNVCDLGETFATCTEDCPECTIASDCTGLNPGTCESVDCVADECVFVHSVPCCGNAVCDLGETFATCTEDCPECTIASDCTGLNPGTCESVDCVANECVLVPTVPCCGNDDSVVFTQVLDIEIRENSAKAGTLGTIVVDRATNLGEARALVKFPNINLPTGATVTSAQLRFFTKNPTSATGSISGYAMSAIWDNNSVWDDVTGGVDLDTNPQSSFSFTPSADEQDVLVDIAASEIQAWVDGVAANEGWVMVSDSSNNWKFRSIDGKASDRPYLTVNYSTC